MKTSTKVTFQTKTIQLSNGEILDYDELGQEYFGKWPTLLLIYGLFGNKEYWQETIRILKIKDKYHIIVPNLRGYAGTTYKKRCLSLQDWAHDLIDLCDKIGLKRYIPIGWCNGAFISIKLAGLVPQKVEKIVLACNAPFDGYQFKYRDQSRETLKQQKREPNEKMFKKIAKYFSPDSEYTLQKFQKCITGTLLQQPQCLQDSVDAMKNPKFEWNKVKAKVLIIQGKQDTLIPIKIMEQQIEKVKQQIQNIVVKIYEGRAHMIPMEDARRFVEDIESFVQGP